MDEGFLDGDGVRMGFLVGLGEDGIVSIGFLVGLGVSGALHVSAEAASKLSCC